MKSGLETKCDFGCRANENHSDFERKSVMQNSTEDDVLLMIEVANDNQRALRTLIDKWKNPLANYFYRSIRNTSTAEDLTQQTFINLYKARKSYEPKAKFSTYIFQIARRLLINEYRRNLRKPSDPTDFSEFDYPEEENKILEINELEDAFDKAVEHLPENWRTAILLLKQQQLSYEEIAETLEIKVSLVKTWIHRARNVLKKELAKFKDK